MVEYSKRLLGNFLKEVPHRNGFFQHSEEAPYLFYVQPETSAQIEPVPRECQPYMSRTPEIESQLCIFVAVNATKWP